MIGAQVGDYAQMHLHLEGRRPPWWTRSGYIEQVRDIAPAGGVTGGLRGREQELAELSAFCLEAEPYLWWRAEPWAGKSALMSTFVLNPPPQVEVVAFFLTARLAAQSDSNAFTDALLDQLAAIVGRRVPSSLTPTARDAHRRALLRAAVEKLQDEGRRLVLVVDGLDEDRGGRVGSGTASVASLLPKIPSHGLRVIVASRPAPQLPDDVPTDHPLRRCRVQDLSVSPYAAEIAIRAKQELDDLLFGGPTERDLLGLITASGGGLTIDELRELTAQPRYRLENLLGGVCGRTIASRSDHTSANSNQVYLFAHETLREVAVQRLDTTLACYRDQLHSWANQYRQQGWPEQTPPYLVRGYPRMLVDAADVTRMVTLAIDPARHARMLEVSGGDAAALTEITACQDLLLQSPQPDLYTLARLSHHRGQIESRNADIPTDLPAVWARIGQPSRAEVLARSLADPYVQTQALSGVAVVVAADGDYDRARRLVTEAEILTRSLTPHWRSQALTAVAGAVAAYGDHDQAEVLARSLAQSLVGPYEQARPLTAVAGMVAARGDYGRAEAFARSLIDPCMRAQTLSAVAAEVAACGDHDRARQLVSEAETLTRSVKTGDEQSGALIAVATAVAASGDHDRAEALAYSLINADQQAQALSALAAAVAASGDHSRAEALTRSAARLFGDRYQEVEAVSAVAAAVAASGDHDRAEALARSRTDRYEQARTLTAVAAAVAAAGDHDRARQLAIEVEAIARSVADAGQQARVLIAVAAAVAACGEHDRAEALARSLTYPYQQARALSAVAAAVAASGDYDRAEALAYSLTNADQQARALIAVATAVAAHGNHDRAEALAYSLTDPFQRAQTLSKVAAAVAASDDHDRARQLATQAEIDARSLTPFGQVQALCAVAAAVAAYGDHDRARQLATQAETGARCLASQAQAQALCAVAAAVAAYGDHDRAEALAYSLTNADQQARALIAVATAVAAHGDHDRAEALAYSMTDPLQRARTLIALAKIVNPQRARRLLGQAFASGRWWLPLPIAATVDPPLVIRLIEAISTNRSGDTY
ncbi:hypothetical protein ACIOBK_02095 [Micromonospora chokoriensis]